MMNGKETHSSYQFSPIRVFIDFIVFKYLKRLR